MTATTAPQNAPVDTSVEWGPHYRPLQAHDDVSTVATPTVRRVRLRILQAARDRVPVLVTGRPGVGKSFAIGRAAEAVEAKLHMTVQWLELAPSTREVGILIDIYQQITGVAAPARTTGHQMLTLLRTTLAEAPRLLVLDEAQFASPTALRNLRWLQEKHTSDFGLVIAGTPDLTKRLPREMRSRLAFHVPIDEITDDAAPGLLASYHPVFADTDPDVIKTINRNYAHGRFRWWAKFLSIVLVRVTGPRADIDAITLTTLNTLTKDIPRG